MVCAFFVRFLEQLGVKPLDRFWRFSLYLRTRVSATVAFLLGL